MTDFSNAVYAGDQLQNGLYADGTFTGSSDATTVASIRFAPDSVFTAPGQEIMGIVTNSTVGGSTQTFTYDGYFTAADGSPAYVFSFGAANGSTVAINADGTTRVLIEDPRLVWVDAMWIDGGGFLYMPAAQLDRMAPFNGGVSKGRCPVSVYRTRIGVGPPPSDHP